jgi:hypothetical protein
MPIRRVAIACGLAAAVGAAVWATAVAAARSGAAPAHPPATVLHAGTKIQHGLLGSSCWTSPAPSGGSMGVCGDTGWQWPSAKQVPARHRGRIVIRLAERPRRLALSEWRAVDEHDQPVGDPTHPSTALHPRRRDGRVVAWVVRFRFPDTKGHSYLQLFAKWAPGDAAYTFHLKLI